VGIVRKLENILQELEPLIRQGKIQGFFNNTKNADILAGLIGDIRDAAMDYQVRSQGKPATLTPDIHFRLRYNKISMTRAVGSL